MVPERVGLALDDAHTRDSRSLDLNANPSTLPALMKPLGVYSGTGWVTLLVGAGLHLYGQVTFPERYELPTTIAGASIVVTSWHVTSWTLPASLGRPVTRI